MLKGKACINCRRRKIKCDGERPSCGQCARSNGAFEDCEYPGTGPTQTQILEDQISHLQNRIHQLESSNEIPTVVPLHHPYSSGSSPRSPSNATQLRLPSDHGSPTSRPSSSPGSRKGSASPPPIQEPSMDVRLNLIDVFYQYSSRLGFFLNVEQFHSSFVLLQEIGHYSRPTPSLLNAIYLWGVHLHPAPPEFLDEKTFLRNALYHLSKDLSSSHPYKIIHGIQAEVLLSYYYLKHGKVLGGNYHANAAVSLSLSSGLHRIRTPVPPHETPTRCSPRAASSPLPKPMDDAEEGERVDAFWAVLILNNTWIAIQESYSMFHDLQTIGVDTPWPMDSFEYQLQLLPSVSSGTIKGFLDSSSIEGFSILALHAKAAVLLEQATVYASNPDEIDAHIPEINDTTTTEFGRIETIIEQFKAQFPLVDQMDVKLSETDALVMVQMMTHAATIKLHFPLVKKGDSASRQKTLSAAQAIAVLTHNIQPSSSITVDPIVGVIWTAACEVLLFELHRADTIVGDNSQWATLLHSIFSQMDRFSAKNIFMKFLVTRLQKNHPTALTFW